jgi:hypothetical protein
MGVKPRSMIEIYTGIICACLPILKAFCKHHFPKVFEGGDEDEPPAFSTGNLVTNEIAIYTDLTTSTEAQSEARSDIWHGHDVAQKEHPSYNSIRMEEFGQDSSATSTVSVQ